MTDKEIEDLIHHILDYNEINVNSDNWRMDIMPEFVEIFRTHMKNKLIIDTINASMIGTTYKNGDHFMGLTTHGKYK